MDLKFDANGLIPAIVQDHYTKEVLTLAYMNAESLAITIDEGRTCFFSRSRQQLWRKGETSGNVQHVVSITADCDKDALVVEVVKDGTDYRTQIPKVLEALESGALSEETIDTACRRVLTWKQNLGLL